MTLEPDQLSREEWERMQLEKIRKEVAYRGLYEDQKSKTFWDKPAGHAIRWIAVGPIAVLAVIAAQIVWQWIAGACWGYTHPAMLLHHPESLGVAFVYLWGVGLLLMFVIAAIAPKHRTGITLFLATFAAMYLLKFQEAPDSIRDGWFEMATWLCIAVSMLKLHSLPER